MSVWCHARDGGHLFFPLDSGLDLRCEVPAFAGMTGSGWWDVWGYFRPGRKTRDPAQLGLHFKFRGPGSCDRGGDA